MNREPSWDCTGIGELATKMTFICLTLGAIAILVTGAGWIFQNYFDPMRESASYSIAYEQVKDLPGLKCIGEGVLDGSDLGQQRTYYFEYFDNWTLKTTWVNVITHKNGDGWQVWSNVKVPMGADNR